MEEFEKNVDNVPPISSLEDTFIVYLQEDNVKMEGIQENYNILGIRGKLGSFVGEPTRFALAT